MDLFSNLSYLKKKFSYSIKEIEKRVFSALTKKGFFYENPLSIKNMYTALGIIALFFTLLSLLGFGIVKNYFPPFPFIVFGIVTYLSLLIFGQFMPRKTDKGTAMKEYLLGYEKFISRVEKNVIEKLFPPEKIPEIFEITLPYAIAFGEVDRWVSAFEGLFMEYPNWYEGSSFTNDATQILSSATRSSESGRGGFFGGGGGGAW